MGPVLKMAFFSHRVMDHPSEKPTVTFKEKAFNLCRDPSSPHKLSDLNVRCHVLNCESTFVRF